MNNFVFQNPVNIIFGKGTISKLTTLISPEQKIMMIYGGGSIKNNGVYNQVINALKERMIVEFGGIEPNPSYESCMQAVNLARIKNINFLLAVGGGSVIDATKFIAAATPFAAEDPWEILLSRGEKIKYALPLGTVLTLPGTGSEMNCVSVISSQGTMEKLAFIHDLVFPRFSILDPEVTYSLPRTQLRNGIVDSFVHVMEQYVTCDIFTPLQDRQAEAVIQTLVELSERIISGKNDYDARATFMWCASQAFNGLLGCGVIEDWSTHLIGHELTAFFGIAHAESLAVVLPAVWKHQKQRKKAKLAQFAKRIWNVTNGTIDQKADTAIENTINFFHNIGMPTRLSDYDIDANDIKKVADRFEQRHQIIGENKNITHEEVKQILEFCL